MDVIVGSHGNSVFNVFRKGQNILRFQHQCMSIIVFLHPLKYFTLFIFLIRAILMCTVVYHCGFDLYFPEH